MGKKGGGGGGAQTVTQTSEPPKYLVPFLKQAMTASQSLYNKGAAPLYPDQTFAPLNDEQRQALEMTKEMATAGSPLVQGAQGFIGDTLSQEGTNPFLDQLLERYGAKANSMVAGNFNKGGRFGSGAHAATAGQAISDATLPYLFDQYNKDQGYKFQAAGMAPALADYDFTNASRIGSVGDVFQGYDQQALDEKIARHDYETGGGEAQNLDEYLARLQGVVPTFGSSSTQTTSGGGGKSGVGSTIGGIVSGLGTLGGIGTGLTSFLGGGSALAGAMGGSAGLLGGLGSLLGIFSDERLKENVKFEGIENGHNVYSYNYKGKPEGERYVGVLADEVEKKNPDAIIEVDGFKAVKYDQIGVKFRRVEEGLKSPDLRAAAAPASRGGMVEAGAAGCSMGGV